MRGAIPGIRTRSQVGPGPCPLAEGFTYSVGCHLCGPKEALERPGPFVCGEGDDNAAQLLRVVNESRGLKRASQLPGWEGGNNVVPCWI